MSYYILQNEQTKGPYTMGQLRAMWNSGAITSETLHCQEGYTEWVSFKKILQQLEPHETPPPVSQFQAQQILKLQAPKKRNAAVVIIVASFVFVLVLFAIMTVLAPLLKGPSNTSSREVEHSSKAALAENNYAVEITDFRAADEADERHLTGKLRNKSSVTLRWVRIEYSLYDTENVKIETATDRTTNLRPGEEWRFKAPVSYQRAIQRAELIAVTCEHGRIL